MVLGVLTRAQTWLNKSMQNTPIGRYFKLEERESTFTGELRAGTATFLMMAYIITVNASILADSGGPCSDNSKQDYQSCFDRTKSDLVVATALSSMIGSLAMGAIANLPLGLAPAMGSNAYLAYDLVGLHGSKSISYQSAMAIVLLEGCAFFFISAFGLRAKLAKLIPVPVRLASAAGIGMFIAFVGLQKAQGVGLVSPDPSTLVTLSSSSLRDPKLWLAFVGFVITCYGLMKDIKGSMIYGIVFVTVVSWFRGTDVSYFSSTPSGDRSYNHFKQIVDIHFIKSTAGAYDFSELTNGDVLVALLTLLYVDVLSTTGTLYTMAELGNFVDDKGTFEGEYSAFLVDSCATIVGSSLGVSTVTVYVESSAGLREGGKTGITAITISVYFFVSVIFSPLLASVPPWAVGPSLVVVGILMMMKVVREVNWSDVGDAAPAFVTMLLMPLTYSISNGIVAGIGLYAVLKLCDCAWRLPEFVMGVKKKVNDSRRNQETDFPANDVVVEV